MSDRKRDALELREKIDVVDREIVQSLDARARLSREIQARLEGESHSIDTDEGEWLSRLVGTSSGDMPADSLRRVLSVVRAEARALEQPVRVAYLGPEAGFTHQMARDYFGAAAIFVECPTAAEALDEVVRGRAVYAVFPFESSVDGLVQPSITALAQTELVLVAERALPATYDLMSRTANMADIDKLYATAAAHASCERFLDRELPRVSVIDVRSPAVAAQLVSEDHGAAAIVPEACGRAAGLEVVRQNVGDAADLRYRYGIASARPAIRSSQDTTCLLFSVDDTPGSLFDVLRHFAERGINLKKLQSRPVSGESWDYVFYVEVSGHVTDRPVVTALEAVKRSTKYLKVLGSFQTQS